MSFTNNVYGGVPQNEMVFTTSNVSSDNASFINLSVSDSATITNLTTVNWSQPNLNASTVVTDTLVVTNTSAVNLDVSGVMNVSDLNISDLNVSDISVSTLNVGDIVIDEAEVTTLRFDDVTNANYSEIQRDNDTLTIAGGYLNAQGTQFNGDIAFTPYNPPNFPPPSMVVQASDGKVYIPNMSALDINTSSLQAIDITASTTIVAPTMNTSTLNASTINVDTDIDVPDINTSQINASNISVDVDLHVTGTTQTDILEADTIAADCDMTSTLKTSSNMYYPNNLLVDFSAAQTATTIELSSNLSLNGIDLLPDLVTAADPTLSMLSGTAQITNANISTLTCDLTPNLTAGTGITITSVGGKPTIASTGYVTDPLNVSQLNASNISIDADLSVTGTATIADADITTLTCDLTPNLTAGTGITITSVGGKPTISSQTFIADPLNLSTLNASQVNASYAYVRWDLNVSNTLYTTANVDAGNSIFANANMVAGGSVTSTGYNFKRTVADGGLTMANMFANANSLDLSMSYDWNIYKTNNSGVRMMQFDFSAGNVNMSNTSINNLSVTSALTTPDATITDLVVPGTATITGTLNHDFSKNVTAGTGISITHVGNQMTIAATGSGVTDPLNISRLNASDVHTEALNVSGSAAFLADGLTVFGQTTTQNISTSNISSTAFITAAGEISAGGGLKATGGSGVFSTGVFHLNNANNGLGDSLELFYTGTEFSMGTTSGKDFRITAGINTGGLVIDGTLNNVNMSNCSITNLSLDDLTYDLTPNLTAGTGITITSVGGKPTITATGAGVTDPLNISQLNASNISVDGDIELIGTSNISANATTATVLKVVAENISVSNDITCSNLTRSYALESVANTSVGFDLSVANDATITRDLQVQRYFDAGKPTFIMLRRSANFTLSGGGQAAIFNQNTSAQVNGEFSTSNGTDVIVTTGGWYRVSWALGFLRISNNGGDRIAVRSYSQTRTAAGGFSFNSFKNTISSSCYIRRSNQCREGHISGYNFVYIPASGAVRIIMECMVEGASSWTSNFLGMQLRGSSNIMVEFVSSAAET